MGVGIHECLCVQLRDGRRVLPHGRGIGLQLGAILKGSQIHIVPNGAVQVAEIGKILHKRKVGKVLGVPPGGVHFL